MQNLVLYTELSCVVDDDPACRANPKILRCSDSAALNKQRDRRRSAKGQETAGQPASHPEKFQPVTNNFRRNHKHREIGSR